MKCEVAEVVLRPVVYYGRCHGHRFEIIYDTVAPDFGGMPWNVQYCGNGHYAPNLDRALGYCAGRGFIQWHSIDELKREIAENTVAAMTEAGKETGIKPPRVEDIM